MRVVYVKYLLGNADPYIVAENCLKGYNGKPFQDDDIVDKQRWVFWSPDSSDTPETYLEREKKEAINIQTVKNGMLAAGFYKAVVHVIKKDLKTMRGLVGLKIPCVGIDEDAEQKSKKKPRPKPTKKVGPPKAAVCQAMTSNLDQLPTAGSTSTTSQDHRSSGNGSTPHVPTVEQGNKSASYAERLIEAQDQLLKEKELRLELVMENAQLRMENEELKKTQISPFGQSSFSTPKFQLSKRSINQAMMTNYCVSPPECNQIIESNVPLDQLLQDLDQSSERDINSLNLSYVGITNNGTEMDQDAVLSNSSFPNSQGWMGNASDESSAPQHIPASTAPSNPAALLVNGNQTSRKKRTKKAFIPNPEDFKTYGPHTSPIRSVPSVQVQILQEKYGPGIKGDSKFVRYLVNPLLWNKKKLENRSVTGRAGTGDCKPRPPCTPYKIQLIRKYMGERIDSEKESQGPDQNFDREKKMRMSKINLAIKDKIRQMKPKLIRTELTDVVVAGKDDDDCDDDDDDDYEDYDDDDYEDDDEEN